MAVSIVDAQFVASYRDTALMPNDGVPEVALVGRSNVGKSTLLNAVAGRKALARTSKSPGQTRLINLFDLKFAPETPLRLADLPGYGYAKVSKKERAEWGEFLGAYLVKRKPLRALLLLIDCRRDVEEEEHGVLEYHGTICVLTKGDKLNAADRARRLKYFASALPGREVIFTSSLDKGGIDELRERLHAEAVR